MRKITVSLMMAVLMVFGAWASNSDATTMYVNQYLGTSGISVTGYSNGMAGEFQLGIGSSSNNSVGYCVDFSKSISIGQSYTSYTFTAASNAPLQYQLGAWIMANYAPGLGNTAWYGATSIDIARSAVQLATWEVIQETTTTSPYNLLTGNFKITWDPTTGGVATTLANGILSNMYSSLYSGGNYSVDASTIANITYAQSSTNQNLLTGSTKVPEPQSALLIGMGLFGIGIFTKYNNNNKK